MQSIDDSMASLAAMVRAQQEEILLLQRQDVIHQGLPRRSAAAKSKNLGTKPGSSLDAGAGTGAFRHLDAMQGALWGVQVEEEDDYEYDGEDEDIPLQAVREKIQNTAGSKNAGMEAVDQNQLGALIQLETLKMLKKLRKQDDDSSSGSEDGGDPLKSMRALPKSGKGIGELSRMRSKFWSNPSRIVREYRKEVQHELGIMDSRQYWTYRDYTQKIRGSFGRMRGLFRLHFALSEILTLLESGKIEEGQAFVVQTLRAIHQSVIDNGGWSTATKLLPIHDPLERRSFGGTERQLQSIHSYEKALLDLKKKPQWPPKKSYQETAEEQEEQGRRK